MENQITFRPIRPEDEALLYQIYASTREEELAQVPWNTAEKEAFLRMQFNAQHQYYQEQFPHAAFQIILGDDRPIGRLYVDRRPDVIHLIDESLSGTGAPLSRFDGLSAGDGFGATVAFALQPKVDGGRDVIIGAYNPGGEEESGLLVQFATELKRDDGVPDNRPPRALRRAVRCRSG